MKRHFALVTGLLGVLSFAACAGNDKPPAGGPGRASLLPIVTVKGTSDFTVPVAFTNPSDGIVRYPFARGGLGLVAGELYQNGKLVEEGLVEYSRPPLKKEQVKELKPNETLIFRYEVPYSRVKPGKYELRLSYEIPPKSVYETEFGLTPMKLEQTIILDVREE